MCALSVPAVRGVRASRLRGGRVARGSTDTATPTSSPAAGWPSATAGEQGTQPCLSAAHGPVVQRARRWAWLKRRGNGRGAPVANHDRGGWMTRERAGAARRPGSRRQRSCWDGRRHAATVRTTGASPRASRCLDQDRADGRAGAGASLALLVPRARACAARGGSAGTSPPSPP